jgi:hypothetical protein
MSSRFARLCTSVAIVLTGGVVATTAAWGQGSPSVTADPNSGAPGSAFTLTLDNFDLVSQCNKDAPSPQTCIYVNFIQGSRTTSLAVATGSGSTTVHVPNACATATSQNCAVAGAATIKATSPNGQTGQTGFTVTGIPATTTTTKATTTTTATSTTSTSSTTSTTAPATTTSESSSTTSTTVVAAKTKKTSSHSDVPRYIAVALVVLAAAATAGVDTRLRRQRL